ncbi:MAG: sensor histidine kinase [Arachnia propionica]|uniref:sensor histidine kinase n=1 Tax=Arachnia propionica TaxID=1750 RepID=UPI0026F53954|nr:sensor histidine kinase [Arachnia propionica]
MDTRELPANWLRTDATITVALVALGCVMAWFTHLTERSFFETPAWLQAVGSIAMTVPLLWRRRFPLISGVVVAVLYVVSAYLTGMEVHISQVSLFVSFYSIGAWSMQRERALLVRILICAGMALWLGVAFALRIIEEVDGTVMAPIRPLLGVFAIQIAVNIAFFAGAWVFGDRSFDQAVEREQLRQAHADIQHLESELVRAAIEQERLRIARELHDIVAHHVTTMSVQAAAARRVIARDPEAATASLKHIEGSARHAVEELRTMVLTLRASDGSDVVPPTVDDLPELVASARASGLDASYEAFGEIPEVSPAVGLTLYRVTQEGLTNATKHAGPGVHVEVRLRGHPDRVELEVSDDGYGEREGLPGTGTGLIGMRERVEAIGGALSAGTKPRGGFRVRAEIPTGVTA